VVSCILNKSYIHPHKVNSFPKYSLRTGLFDEKGTPLLQFFFTIIQSNIDYVIGNAEAYVIRVCPNNPFLWLQIMHFLTQFYVFGLSNLYFEQ